MSKATYYKQLTLFTLIVAVILFLVQFKYDISQYIWLCLAYFFLLTVGVNFVLKSGLNKSNTTFITRTYSAIGIRFLFSLIPLILYFMLAVKVQLMFAIAYLFLYFFYTMFEIYCLVVNLRPDSKKDKA